MSTGSSVLILGASRGLDDEDRDAIAALPKDRGYVTPAFAPDRDALML